MSKRIKIKYPQVEKKPEIGLLYLTKAAREAEAIISKETMTAAFISRFDQVPEEVFFGPPNGTVIYAGPIKENRR